MPAVAVGLGAEIIEKHITLDRNMKGTDHRGSLEPEGIWRMVRDIRNTEFAIGEKAIFVSDKVLSTRVKLERSIATLRTISAGEIISESDLHMLSPGDGFKWAEKERIIGKRAAVEIPANEIIYQEMIKS
jgi:sialic acid synthase